MALDAFLARRAAEIMRAGALVVSSSDDYDAIDTPRLPHDARHLLAITISLPLFSRLRVVDAAQQRGFLYLDDFDDAGHTAMLSRSEYLSAMRRRSA